MKSTVKRTRRHFDFGDTFGYLLQPILKGGHATAAASCRFTVQGPESVGCDAKNWGVWIRTIMQTGGQLPPLHHAWQVQRSSGWISGDSHEAANAVLDCFGLTIEDVFDRFGQPEVGKVYSVDLVDICEALAPEIMRRNVDHVATAIA